MKILFDTQKIVSDENGFTCVLLRKEYEDDVLLHTVDMGSYDAPELLGEIMNYYNGGGDHFCITKLVANALRYEAKDAIVEDIKNWFTENNHRVPLSSIGIFFGVNLYEMSIYLNFLVEYFDREVAEYIELGDVLNNTISDFVAEIIYKLLDEIKEVE